MPAEYAPACRWYRPGEDDDRFSAIFRGGKVSSSSLPEIMFVSRKSFFWSLLVPVVGHYAQVTSNWLTIQQI